MLPAPNLRGSCVLSNNFVRDSTEDVSTFLGNACDLKIRLPKIRFCFGRKLHRLTTQPIDPCRTFEAAADFAITSAAVAAHG
jgi:hypothetical protein